MILSLLLGATVVAQAIATPQPVPTVYGSYGSLPVIITVSTSAVCTTLHETVVPVGYIAKTNDAAFADVKRRTLKVAMSQLSDDTDFKFLAHHDQSDVDAVVTNSNLAMKLIAESEKRYPAQKNPEIEAMRDELVRIIDLQRQYNSIVDAISGAYLDSLDDKDLYGGMYAQNSTGVQQRVIESKQDFINANRVLLGLAPFDTEPLPGTNPLSREEQANPLTQAGGAASPPPHEDGSAAQIQDELADAESRLQVTAVAALQLCRHAGEPSPRP